MDMAKGGGFLARLGIGLKKSATSSDAGKGKFAPEKVLPLDEKFVSQFTEGGGNFVYCADKADGITALKHYCAEHQWRGLFISSPSIADWENDITLETTFQNDGQFQVVLSTCEALIAFNGGIMVHGHHTGGRKLADLPKHHILVAYTSQIVANLRDGMTAINQKYRDNRPGNIAVIRPPHDQAVELAAADPNKDRTVFLILIEDEA
jgi:L-lactate dehydrogenase complex protein LldG